jgi:hypothetical protein
MYFSQNLLTCVKLLLVTNGKIKHKRRSFSINTLYKYLKKQQQQNYKKHFQIYTEPKKETFAKYMPVVQGYHLDVHTYIHAVACKTRLFFLQNRSANSHYKSPICLFNVKIEFQKDWKTVLTYLHSNLEKVSFLFQ